jgi:predicted TIM-barrel fold metal-dependent hydrolase
MSSLSGRIDVHHHVLPEFYKDVQRSIGITGTAYRGFPEWSPESSLSLMDRLGIAATIFSFTSPGIYFGDLQQTRELALRCNDFLAETAARNPKRFGGFAFLPLPDVDASLKEIGRVVDELKLDGVCLLTNVNNVYIGHPDFEEVYAELNRRKVVTFIHPCYPAGVEARDWDIPRMLIDYPFETTKVATNLIFNGVTTRYPDIKFLLSHAGGTLPMLAHRLSVFDKQTKFKDNYPDGALAHIARFYYDTALSGHAAPLDALRAFVPDSQILFGTDYPYVTPEVAAAETAGFDSYRSLVGAARMRVERGNAEILWSRFAQESA